ncbi:hypothetical protein SDC9_60265 [bioreactor metagenome]|uniref:Uncharacterized protein n=1 Tax=bioreactor metagenome TaxID=1076179 RepID=A0A644XCI5_9ZZZZ
MGRKVVLYIDAMIMPDKNAAAQRATAICKSLIDIGKKPVIVGLKKDINHNISVLETLENYSGIDCYAVKYPVSIKEWLDRMITIKPFIDVVHRYGKENIHSIIAMDYEVIALYRLRKYCDRNNIRLIADSVEWYGKSKLKFPINIVKDLDTAFRMKYVYPKLDYMICISHYLYQYYLDKIPNIVEIPGTVDECDLKWSKIKKYTGNDILTIGYAGHPGFNCEKERLDWLIKAICELNQEGIACKLLIAGFDKSIIEDYLPDLKKHRFYSSSIKYYGKLSHLDCLNMIATCDFSAIIREDKRVTRAGFPTKLSESFGCKTPVITTPSSNISDFIEAGRNGLITKDFSYDSLKQVLFQAYNISLGEKLEMHKKLVNPLVYRIFNKKLANLLA